MKTLAGQKAIYHHIIFAKFLSESIFDLEIYSALTEHF